MEEKPLHVGIILDGNRRWAKNKGLMPWDGHKAGFDKLKELFEAAKEAEIKELSLYCFSTQNFSRDKKEVDFLMNIFVKAAEDLLKDKKVHENKVKIRFIGRLHMLPEKVQKAAKEVMEATKDYDNYIANFCVAYGGREEIVDAVNKVLKSGVDKVDEESFANYLYIQNSPDLIIRTSGEQRLSNFLTWHSTYSELFFLEKHWPDFEKQDLFDIVKEFKEKRQRRFGN
ncbi:di-trans,poly-cis-decaprenylcistransferase [Candidatus Woesearchaeota archaeon B3_Woes]|nr:MAG: di-trans,poly-cis-decaprenylcistransferase [Candidatus Woesearchaeota archaeon B3_Woes]